MIANFYTSVWNEKYLNLATVSKDDVKIMILSCNLMTNHDYLLLVNTAFNSIPTFLLTPNVNYSGRTAPLTSKVAFYIFIQQIWLLNILNTVYNLRFFFSSKCSLFHNSNVFGSCIIHILYTGCAKIKKNNSGAKRLMKLLCFICNILARLCDIVP